jgi:hypothetical protein
MESNINGKWEPTWKPEIDENFWWEMLVENLIDSGAAETAYGIHEYDKLYEKLVSRFKTMSKEKIRQEYFNDEFIHPDISLQWPYPNEKKYKAYYVGYCPCKSRDYSWFAVIGGVRGYGSDSVFETNKGIPDDSCMEIKHEVESYGYGCDGHSHSWLMVDEILKNPKCIKFPQYKWLKKFVKDPKNTRMVFFFDN